MQPRCWRPSGPWRQAPRHADLEPAVLGPHHPVPAVQWPRVGSDPSAHVRRFRGERRSRRPPGHVGRPASSRPAGRGQRRRPGAGRRQHAPGRRGHGGTALAPERLPPLPTASLDTNAGNSVDLVLPDPDTEALLQDPGLAADPVRSAQVLFGRTRHHLAGVTGAEPAHGARRGARAALGAARRLLGPGAAAAGRRAVPAARPPPGLRRAGHARRSSLWTSRRPRSPRSRVPTWTASTRSAATSRPSVRCSVYADPEPNRLERDLLYAEAGAYVGNEAAGRAWIDDVHTTVNNFFARARPQESREYTFTSREGTIPLRMGDPGPTP